MDADARIALEQAQLKAQAARTRALDVLQGKERATGAVVEAPAAGRAGRAASGRAGESQAGRTGASGATGLER